MLLRWSDQQLKVYGLGFGGEAKYDVATGRMTSLGASLGFVKFNLRLAPLVAEEGSTFCLAPRQRRGSEGNGLGELFSNAPWNQKDT